MNCPTCHRPMPHQGKRGPATIEDLVAENADLEVYQHLDVRAAILRCEAWCRANGKILTRRRVTNWLNKDAAERVAAPAQTVQPLPPVSETFKAWTPPPLSEPAFVKPEPESLKALLARLGTPASHETASPPPRRRHA